MSRSCAASRWLRATAAATAVCAAPAFAEDRRKDVRFGADYVADGFVNVTGGIGRGYRQMGMLDITAEADVSGLELFANAQWVHGRSISEELAGDGQVLSNIDAPEGVRLFEAWAKMPLGDRGYVKTGLIDLNGDFDVQRTGALFLNSSHGIGPDFSQSGENGPSIFPTSATAVVGGWDGQGWSARLGLFDAVAGDPDRPARTVARFPGTTGLLAVAEADIRVAPGVEVQLGGWHYTSSFEPLDPEQPKRRRDNRGAYVQVEAVLGRLAGRPVESWVRFGTANAGINPIRDYIGGGLALGEENARWGLALAHARLGQTAIGLGAERAETAIELTHVREIGDRLTVQPNVQYIVNPGWDPDRRNALVLGVRLQLRLL